MEYKEFKEKLLQGLRRKCGDNTEVVEENVLKNNGRHHDCIAVYKKGKDYNISPTIYVERLYEDFCRGEMNMEECVNENFLMVEEHVHSENIPEFAEHLAEWDYVKERVYPLLISTHKNKELLEELVSFPMLDMSIVFVIRLMLPEWNASAKIKMPQLRGYGITEMELYRQAMKNMKKEGYNIRNIREVLADMGEYAGSDMETLLPEDEELPLYIFTNRVKYYGAAGILDKELLEKVTKGKDHYILPSSIHETILVPASADCDPEWLNELVAMVNATQVAEEERLTDHCYYCDGRTGEVRMCR